LQDQKFSGLPLGGHECSKRIEVDPFFPFVCNHSSLRPVFTGKIGAGRRPLAVLLRYLSGDILRKMLLRSLKVAVRGTGVCTDWKNDARGRSLLFGSGCASASLPPAKTASSNSCSGRLVKPATYRARNFLMELVGQLTASIALPCRSANHREIERGASVRVDPGGEPSEDQVGAHEELKRTIITSARQQLCIAVGIATSGRREILSRTIDLIARQKRLPDIPVICPAAADDMDPAWIERFPFSTVVWTGRRGLTTQPNEILSAAGNADVIVFFDNDFFPQSDYLWEVETIFTQIPDVVAATGRPMRWCEWSGTER
jgi:hypothetical protein